MDDRDQRFLEIVADPANLEQLRELFKQFGLGDRFEQANGL